MNGQFVAVVAVGLSNKDAIKTKSSPAVHCANFSMCPDEPDGISDASASTRFDEMKTNLEDHIAEMVQNRLRTYDAKITELQGAIDQTRIESQNANNELKTEFNTLSQQQNAIQQQIVQGNTSVVQQMQTLFQQMQSSLNTRLDALENDAKRPRKENDI